MSIVAKVKKLVPKTTKGWIVAGGGVAAAGLFANYLIAGPEHSIVGQLLHKLHGGGGGGGAPGAGRAAVPAMPMSPGMPMVFVEPTMAPNFFWRFKRHDERHWGHPHHPHHPHAYAPPVPYAPMHPPMHPHHHHHRHHPQPGFEFHAEHHVDPHAAVAHVYDQAHAHPGVHIDPQTGQHVTGVASKPHNPDKSHMHVYAPGAKGIANEPTYIAEGIVDPRAAVQGGYGVE